MLSYFNTPSCCVTVGSVTGTLLHYLSSEHVVVVLEAGQRGSIVHHLAHTPLGSEEHGLAGRGRLSGKIHLEVRPLHLLTQPYSRVYSKVYRNKW